MAEVPPFPLARASVSVGAQLVSSCLPTLAAQTPSKSGKYKFPVLPSLLRQELQDEEQVVWAIFTHTTVRATILSLWNYHISFALKLTQDSAQSLVGTPELCLPL